ncbi:MAG: DUF128 domain-containing protein [Halobacteriota archaeon]|nr:DUF128 domain-containing protein [Halobacteriota archaeon]
MNDQEQIRFTISRISDLKFNMTLDPRIKSGSVISNFSIIREDDLQDALDIFNQVSSIGLVVSPYFRILREGESMGTMKVGEGEVGLATVCSITIDGVLMKSGVPTNLKGGGIVQVVKGRPMRFTHFIDYRYTTIDPLEVLMSQKLTSVMNVVKTGSGRILANLREAPMVARDAIEETLDLLNAAGFDGVLEVGEPNSDIFGVTLDRDHIGIAVIGGTNPLAAIQEAGICIRTGALSDLIDLSKMEAIR